MQAFVNFDKPVCTFLYTFDHVGIGQNLVLSFSCQCQDDGENCTKAYYTPYCYIHVRLRVIFSLCFTELSPNLSQTNDAILRGSVNHNEKCAVRRLKYAVYAAAQSL